MSKQDLECAILFADIAGSTRIYQTLGDERAQACITACLTRLTLIASRHEGVLIKTIGDEIMCRFPTADAALQAACAMHESLRDDPPPSELPVNVRIGTHYGPVILELNARPGLAVQLANRAGLRPRLTAVDDTWRPDRPFEERITLAREIASSGKLA